MADKPTNKERLKELNEKIEAGIREVFDSGKYAEYLKVMSRFPTYLRRSRQASGKCLTAASMPSI